MSNEDSDTGSPDGDRPRDPFRPGFEDRFWLVLLALIVAVLFVVGLMGGDSGGGHPDGYTGWR
ncbi:hypothetical protein [Streptomyces xanthophaeus]|uniref:Uncharacterized protein n=1 Tax=Streptomyces xanthophaeus TaxID=67385 RepID=A0A919GST3_9ACTN|nr:hypothetical protein [Streptomyces xanthophaeus]WCD83811.1 hypothetical protein KPP03845_100130 [Streptomyces xanthophaeus]GHI82934.1 hypothetical protein Sxan_02980 [Streptomyces xanthophaeus]